MKHFLLLAALLIFPRFSFGIEVTDLLSEWTPANSGTIANLRAVAYGNGRFVAVSTMNHVVVSADGTNWQTQSLNVTTLTDIAFGAGQFVAVGAAGVIITSSNGVHWTQQPIETNRSFGCVIHAAGQFVGGGTSGNIFTSTDGLTWTQRTSNNTNSGLPYLNGTIHDIGYGYGQFLAIRGGFGGDVFSTNGVDWVVRTNNALTVDYFGIAGGGYPGWVRVGVNGLIYYSQDGLNWNRSLTFPLPHVTRTFRSVNGGGDIYVAVGDGGTIVSSQLYHSSLIIPSGTTQNLNDVVCGAGRFVIVGDAGTILTVQTRPRITDFQLFTNSIAQLKARGVYQQSYILKASTNLIDWLETAIGIGDENGDLTVWDTYYPPLSPHLFYQLDTEF